MKKNTRIRVSILSVILVSLITFSFVLKSADEYEKKWIDDQFVLLKEVAKGQYFDLENPVVVEIMTQGKLLWKEKFTSNLIIGSGIIGIYSIFIGTFLFINRKLNQ